MRVLGRRFVAAAVAGFVAASAALAWRGRTTPREPQRFPRPAERVRQVGYFIQWGIYGRGFFVKNLDTSGAARPADPPRLRVRQRRAGGRRTSTCQSGDVWADYERPVPAEESVDGVADQWGEPLNGNFGQLLKLKAKYPEPQGAAVARRLDAGRSTSPTRRSPRSPGRRSCRPVWTGSSRATCPRSARRRRRARLGGRPLRRHRPRLGVARQRGQRRQHRAPRGQGELHPAAAEFRRQLDAYGAADRTSTTS